MKVRQLLTALILTFVSTILSASGAGSVSLLPVKINVNDKAALQRGAQFFMNYCSGCHSLRYLRYNRMARDLGLTTFTGEVDDDLLVNNLIFTSAKIADPIQISMPASEARKWFGVAPPDLSLIARVRSASWLYTYLKSFYGDQSRPFGANNHLIPDVAMPNILQPLIDPGSREKMSAEAFDRTLQDLVTFLVYTSEPDQLIRYRLGGWVLGFLCFFLILCYGLKKIYWQKNSLCHPREGGDPSIKQGKAPI
ncbi:cytochrome c1 [Legionella dresdenensis]|uniref:Cytochrome c1 n=1 Tax=Legionella dresdenensis TaxID=450200 RepID=A0ABV8CEU3_9GAMM